MDDRVNDAGQFDLDTPNSDQLKISDLLMKLRDKIVHQEHRKSEFSDIIYLYERVLTHVRHAKLCCIFRTYDETPWLNRKKTTLVKVLVDF